MDDEISVEERKFSTSENSKGLWCPYKPIICQEGYCRHCQVYIDWQEGNGGSMKERWLTGWRDE